MWGCSVQKEAIPPTASRKRNVAPKPFDVYADQQHESDQVLPYQAIMIIDLRKLRSFRCLIDCFSKVCHLKTAQNGLMMRSSFPITSNIFNKFELRFFACFWLLGIFIEVFEVGNLPLWMVNILCGWWPSILDGEFSLSSVDPPWD